MTRHRDTHRTPAVDDKGKKPSGDAPNLPEPEPPAPTIRTPTNPAPPSASASTPAVIGAGRSEVVDHSPSDLPGAAPAPDPEAAAPQAADQFQPDRAAGATPGNETLDTTRVPVVAAPTPRQFRSVEIVSAVQYRDVMREHDTLPDGVVVTSGFDIHDVPVVSNTRIYDGDWILTDAHGARRVVDAETFAAAYAPVDPIAAEPLPVPAEPLKEGHAYVDLSDERGGFTRIQVPARESRAFSLTIAGVAYAHVSTAGDGVWQYRTA